MPESNVIGQSLIGFGEAGQAFAPGAVWRAYDVKTDGPQADAMRADYARVGVLGCATLAEALDGAGVVLSLVTADQALAVAETAAAYLGKGALFFDLNSVAPGTKRQAAAFIEAAGGRYVDVAVMAPVNPSRLATPLLVSGPHVDEAMAMLAALGFGNLSEAGATVGRASTIKMLRSVMYKGLEALTAECLIAAERAGLRDEVLAMLEADWADRAGYRLDRMMVHGLRRAAEMEEVARTLEGLGMEPLMTRGTIARQREVGERGMATPPSTTLSTLAEMLEKLAQ